MSSKQKNGTLEGIDLAYFYCFAAAAFLLPLVYTLPGYIDSAFIAYYPKLFLLQVISLVLTAVWFLRQRVDTRNGFVSSPFLLPIFLMLALASISVTYAQNRVETLIHLSHQLSLTVLFLGLVNSLHGKTIKRFLQPIGLAAAAVSIVGLIQFPGLGFLWIPSSGMPSSTLGYRNFAAMYLILSIPLSVLLYVEARRRLHVWVWGVSAALQITFLICTRTRGAWIALTLSLLAACVGSVWLKVRDKFPSGRRLSRSHLHVLAAGAAVIIAYSALVSPNMGDVGLAKRSPEKIGLTESVSSLFDKESNKNRLKLWKHTMAMIADNPITGVGAGNWQFVYPSYDLGDVVWKGATPRRPHNDYLWITAELGIPGLLLFLWILWLALSRCFLLCVAATTRSGFWLPLSLAVALLAVLAHSFVSFPKERVEPSFLLWMVLACIAVLDSERKPRRTSPNIGWRYAQVGVGVLLALSIWVSLRAVSFDRHHARAVAYSEREDWNRVIRETTLALEYGVFDPQAYLLQGLGYFARGEYSESVRNNLLCLEYHPYLHNAYNNLGMAYNGQKNYDEALVVLNRLKRLNPNHVEVHANLAMAYQGLERNDEAISEFQQAVAMDTMTSQFRYLLGAAYEQKGQSELAASEYRRILRKDPDDIATRYRLGVTLQDQNEHAKAAAELFRVLQTDREYLPAYFSLGEVYEAQGDTNRAIAAYTAFAKRWKLDPKALTDVIERLKALRRPSH
jgi:tetratricopeptide (TPR) repeat protein/O-antigen ligase